MNAKKQRALELRNKERADRRASDSLWKLTPHERAELIALRAREARLTRELEMMNGELIRTMVSMDVALREQRRMVTLVGELERQLRDYGLVLSISSNNTPILTEFNWTWVETAVQKVQKRRDMASDQTRDIVNARQRQIILDEDA